MSTLPPQAFEIAPQVFCNMSRHRKERRYSLYAAEDLALTRISMLRNAVKAIAQLRKGSREVKKDDVDKIKEWYKRRDRRIDSSIRVFYFSNTDGSSITQYSH